MRMQRRAFFALIGPVVALPVSAIAQSRPVIGYLGTRNAEGDTSYIEAFRQGLADLGHIEGRTIEIEWHSADEDLEITSWAAYGLGHACKGRERTPIKLKKAPGQ